MSEHTTDTTKRSTRAATEIVSDAAGKDGIPNVQGTVRVAPKVLIELIELTVTDVPRVVELRSRPKRPKPDSESRGKSYDDGKVRVGVLGDQIEADIAISIQQGTNVAELSAEVQRRVGVAAGQMLGMTVTSVNIYIDDVVNAPA